MVRSNWRSNKCIQSIGRIKRAITRDLKVLRVKSDVWNVWEFNCKPLKLASNQLIMIVECGWSNNEIQRWMIHVANKKGLDLNQRKKFRNQLKKGKRWSTLRSQRGQFYHPHVKRFAHAITIGHTMLLHGEPWPSRFCFLISFPTSWKATNASI